MSWQRPHLEVRALAVPDEPDDRADDAVLVAAARADRQAFLALCDRYQSPVHRYCYPKLGSRERAEDATSEVFLKALAGLDGYRASGPGAFAGWLVHSDGETVWVAPSGLVKIDAATAEVVAVVHFPVEIRTPPAVTFGGGQPGSARAKARTLQPRISSSLSPRIGSRS